VTSRARPFDRDIPYLNFHPMTETVSAMHETQGNYHASQVPTVNNRQLPRICEDADPESWVREADKSDN
jgi:hypothetical protein